MTPFLKAFEDLLSFLRVRLELVSFEAQEALGRFLKRLLLLALALIAGLVGYVCLLASLIALLSKWIGGSWFYWGMGVGLGHLISAWGLLTIRRRISEVPSFEITRQEFKKDKAWYLSSQRDE